VRTLGALALALGLGLAACGGGGGAEADALNKLKDRMCACKDAACIEAVSKDARAVRDAVDAKYKDVTDIPGPILHANTEMQKCRRALQKQLDGAPIGAGAAPGSGSATP
jgi:hypothetical protein